MKAAGRAGTLGDAPIEQQYRQMMNDLAAALDVFFNGDLKADNRKVGFILMAFDFEGAPGARCNYISNCDRSDVVTLLKEQLARFEGMPDIEGRA